ncbi:hypothetical protein FQN50_009557 [Emmonsiellopsis sp. PD_5]|nr:hypothetical protein FQN50_009557 [Emmonsiellopsis sp. PD_5]
MSLSIDQAIAKLLTTAETIKLRKGVKPHEGKRIQQAFALLTRRPTSNSVKTAGRVDKYQHFLEAISDYDRGPQLAVNCAVGLGQSAIAAMKEHTRLHLPVEIAKHTDALTDPRIRDIAGEYSAEAEVPSTTGPERAVSRISQPRQMQASVPPEPSPFVQEQPPAEYALQSATEEGRDRHGYQQVQGHQTSPFSGRIFELTLQDAQAILVSDQVGSEVWLTETYGNV